MNAKPFFAPARSRQPWLPGLCTALLLSLPSLTMAAGEIPRQLLAHKAAKSQLLWRNGEAIDGELKDGGPAEILWKSSLFLDPLTLSREFVRQMDFKEGTMEQKGAFRVGLADGSHLTGDLVRVDGQIIVLKSERCGEVTLKRDAVVYFERLNGAGLVAAGPLALLKGGAEITQNNPQGAGPLKFAAAGYAGSHAFNQLSCVKQDLPEKVIVDLRFRTDGPPEFNLQAGMDKQSIFVETWGDELVLVMGDRFASAGAKFDEKARVAHLRLAWDRKEGRCSLYGADGQLWAEILPETKTAEPEKKEEKEKPKGSWLSRLLGGAWPALNVPPVVKVIAPLGKPMMNNVAAVQNGVSLVNKGQGIMIERFSVAGWSGQPPPAVVAAAPCVETDAEIIEGEPEKLEGDKLTLRLKDGSAKEVPMAVLRAIRWVREIKMERDPALTDFWYDDGSLLRGKLGEIKDGKASMETAFSPVTISASITGVRYITLPDAPKEEKVPEKKDGAINPDTKVEKLDTLTLGRTSLRGRIVTNGGKVPQFLVFGSSKPATPTDAGGMILSRALDPEAKFERAKALLHINGQQSLPVTLTDMDRKRVAFTWKAAEKQELEAEKVYAVQFLPPPAGDEEFASSSWQIIGKQDAKKPVRRPNGDILLSPGTGIGHPWVLQGGDINFKVSRDRGGMGTLRIRLFCNGVQRETGSLSFIVADWGNNLYCGLEREEGQLNSNTEVISRASGNEVRISFQGSYVEFYVNDVSVARTDMATIKRKRAGSGLVLETASLWGNTEGSVKVSSFATKASALMASPPGFLESAKKEALLLPRLRRDSPPRHMLIGINGDLLRGEIEGVTAAHYVFRSGLETFNVPRDRVTAVVTLAKPEKRDPVAPVAEAPKKEEPKQEGGSGLLGALFGKKPQIRVADAGRGVIRKGGVIEGEGDEEKAAGTEPPDKDVPNDGEQWLDLSSGGRLAVKVDKWETETVTGTHAQLGKVTIPVAQVYRVGMRPPNVSGAWAALSNWKLENTPDPTIPKDDKEGGGGDAGSGEPAPDFKLATLDGKEVSLKEAKGKVIVLDFWATWCGPCVKSLPGLIAAMAEFPEDKVIFLAVNQGETKDQVQKFLDARGFKMRVGMDGNQSVGKSFKVEGIPHTVVIDTEGKIALSKTGYTAGGDKEIADSVKKALNGAGVSAAEPGDKEEPAEPEKKAPPASPDPVGDGFLPPPVLK